MLNQFYQKLTFLGLSKLITSYLLLNIVIFVHEFGHYVVSKIYEFEVEEFSMGMGPLLYQWQLNDLKVSLRIPFGAYVKMSEKPQDSEETSDGYIKSCINYISNLTTDKECNQKRYMEDASTAETIFIYFAGPAFNFLFSIICFSFIFTIYGKIDSKIIVKENYKEFLQGDVISRVNGSNVKNIAMLKMYWQNDKNNIVEVHRASDSLLYYVDNLDITRCENKRIENTGQSISNMKQFSILEFLEIIEEGVLEAILHVWNMIEMQFSNLLYMIKTANINNMKSIIGILKNSDTNSVFSSLNFMSSISVALGAMNLIPIIPLDGGGIKMACIKHLFGNVIHDLLMHYYANASLVFILCLSGIIVVRDLWGLIQ